jgi:hypothetical protein
MGNMMCNEPAYRLLPAEARELLLNCLMSGCMRMPRKPSAAFLRRLAQDTIQRWHWLSAPASSVEQLGFVCCVLAVKSTKDLCVQLALLFFIGW